MMIVSIFSYYVFAGMDPFKVNRSTWIKQINKIVIDELCDQKSYFVQCFDIDQVRCESLGKAILNRCLERSKIPEIVDTSYQGVGMANDLSYCVAIQYEKELKNKKSVEDKCKQRGLFK